MKILLLSDIHANYPALLAVAHRFKAISFDAVCNCGDSTVYAPFPNETLHWLQTHTCYSILGNTDRKVIKLLKGSTFKKPKKKEKRIMYTWTAENLSKRNSNYLLSLKKTATLQMGTHSIALFHGSPEHPNEFLFPSTPDKRFLELSESCAAGIIVTGHSHMPYHKIVNNTHFINPGSVGRMFDGNPAASCAVLTLTDSEIDVNHFRIQYDSAPLLQALKTNKLPEIYCLMFRKGKKLN